MVNGPQVLVILDGASEPLGDGPTSLERAATPALDALCAEGAVRPLRTVAPGLEPGSESAIPALLGWTPTGPVDRGAVEAAARGIAVGSGERAWRIDVRAAATGARAAADAVARAAAALRARLPRHAVHELGGHRLLAVGPAPLPLGAESRLADLPPSLASSRRGTTPPAPRSPVPLAAGAPLPDVTLHRWPEGRVPPRILDATTVVVAAPGAAAGIARLMGAAVVVPARATGRPGSDLAAKGAVAVAALRAGAARVVVHVGGPDEAAHERDAAAKAAAIAAADAHVVGPLAAALRDAGAGALRVCPDHGCDPRDGRHDASPVPCLDWSPARRSLAEPPLPALLARSAVRLTERAVASLPVVELAPPPAAPVPA